MQENIRFYYQCSELTAVRRELPDYSSLNAQNCQVTLKRLDLAFQAFFRRVKAGDKRAGFLALNLMTAILDSVIKPMAMVGD